MNHAQDERYSYNSANIKFQMKWFTINKNTQKVGCQPACNITEEEIGNLVQEEK